MSGTVHNVITRRQFTFTGVSTGTSLEVPLIRAIDVAEAKAIDLVVRVHAASIGTNGQIEVKCCPVSLTSEEPNTDFTNSTDLGTVTLDDTTAASDLLLTSLTAPWGHMIRMFVKGIQPGGGAVTMTATLSIDIVVRDN